MRTCANRYFEHLTFAKEIVRGVRAADLREQLFGKAGCSASGPSKREERCKLINDILDGGSGRFSYLNPDLVDTINLNTDVMNDICIICGVDSGHFEQNRTFLDVLLLKRRNAIAHGQQEYIQTDEIDDFVANILALMASFRNLLENKVYTKAYAA